MSAEQTSSERQVVEVAPQRERRHRLTGTQVTIIVVAALLTIVPSTAVAVTTSFVSIVDAKTGAAAGVSNGDQLDVRGEVSTSDIVPTSSWSKNIEINHSGQISEVHFVFGAPQGQGLTIGEVSALGNYPDGPYLGLETKYVAAGNACPSTIRIVVSSFMWTGAATGNSNRSMAFTFPIPLTVEPHANQRSCLYLLIDGYREVAEVTVVGAQGPSR